LPFRADVDTRVKEGPQQSPITQQHAKQFVVVDVDVVETSGMEKIITVYENCDSSSMT
jgi:hypothetical protein